LNEKLVRLIPGTVSSTSIEEVLSSFLIECKAKNLSPRSIECYEERIGYFIEFLKLYFPNLNLNSISPNHIRLFIKFLQEREHKKIKGGRLSSYTVKGIVVALKVFFKFLLSEGYIDYNPAEKISPPKIQKKIIETLSKEQIEKILSIPNKKRFTGFRDYVILLTFLDTGLRLSELINIKISQIDFSTNTLLVLGKGNKERKVPFGISLRKALEKYLKWRGDIPGQDILFVNQFGEKLKIRRVEKIVGDCGKKAKIMNVRVSPHTLRHTFAKMSLLNGMDVITLQYILGHNSLEMVRNYVNLTSQEVALQQNRFSVIDKIGIKGVTSRKKLWKF
jgi:integrase/recombinase XerD